ncbi:homeobox leucine-zipper protein [Artemisia annua]|uniref:Homeobox leucine-zipper protein n=1 Tax=Artemisia annua TaxID=35608 RepID=A0A2U1M102_ARTAN|nr:homeobox leucine-zipper protein [Artemisia annua]
MGGSGPYLGWAARQRICIHRNIYPGDDDGSHVMMSRGSSDFELGEIASVLKSIRRLFSGENSCRINIHSVLESAFNQHQNFRRNNAAGDRDAFKQFTLFLSMARTFQMLPMIAVKLFSLSALPDSSQFMFHCYKPDNWSDRQTMVQFLREYRLEWTDFSVDAYFAASVKGFSGMRARRFTCSQIIMPLSQTIEHAEEYLLLQGVRVRNGG